MKKCRSLFRLLAHEADIAVRYHSFNLKVGFERYHDGQSLSRGHHSPDRVYRKLLHYPIHRRREQLQLGPSLRLDHVLGEPANLLFCFRQFFEKIASILRSRFQTRLFKRRYRGICLPVFALLDLKIVLLTDEILELRQVDDLGAEFFAVEVLANLDPLLQQRNGRFELAYAGGNGFALRLFLRQLAIDLGELGILLGDLRNQELTMSSGNPLPISFRRSSASRPSISRS